MFQITESMQIYWKKTDEPKATAFDTALIETELSIILPVPYVEFITQYGFVFFDEDCDGFDYSIIFPDLNEIYQGNISYLKGPNHLVIGYRNSTINSVDDGLPAFPKNYFPIGNDEGQGQVLLKMDGEDTGSVWYWPYNEWAWGAETNTWLGFVAKDFYEFINKLRPYE